jgi:DNA ligase (NAD+)
MNKKGEHIRSNAYKKAEESILSITKDIYSVNDVNGQKGIGDTIKRKLQEYLDTGKIKVLEEYENSPEVILSDVYGIGPKKAKDLVNQGITTIKKLREEKYNVLNNVQQKGLKYYDDILKRIPRDEIIQYDKHIKMNLDSLNDINARYEIVGSYRRENKTSGDIDIIITSPNPITYERLLDVMIENKFIIEVLSRGKHKCLVIGKIPESPHYRRIDFLYAPPKEYPFSILYFTGSKGFNVVMRGHSLKRGYSLNEHGFTPSVSKVFTTEKSIFDFLDLRYIEPKDRYDGRSVILKGIDITEEKNIENEENTQNSEDYIKNSDDDVKETIKRIKGEVEIKQNIKKTIKRIKGEVYDKTRRNKIQSNTKDKKITRKREPKIKGELKPQSENKGELKLQSQNEEESKLQSNIKEKRTRKKREPKMKGKLKPQSENKGELKLQSKNEEESKLQSNIKEKRTRKKIEPKKIEPKKIEPKKIEPKKIEPKKIEPKKIEPENEINNEKKSKKREPENEINNEKKSKKKNIDMIETMSIINEFKKHGMSLLERLSENELENILEYATRAYFNENSTLTDNEYDIIKEYTSNKYPKLQILTKIGAPISGKNKVSLPFEMPSMDKIKPDSKALELWKTKYGGPYVLSCKLDGVSGLYMSDKNGEHKLFTRGDGLIGQNISHLIPNINIPKIQKGMAVRGEFIIPKSVFTEKYSDKFANPRNLVSGIINRKDIDEKSKDIHFVAYEVIQPHIKPSEQIKLLETNNFKVVKNIFVSSISNQYLSDILLDWRKSNEYEIDGVIVTDDAIYKRESGNPDYAFAFKMVLSDQVAEAKVVDVEWEASKDGYLKPRVRIEPIKLGGVTIEYATGFNGKFIEDNKIGIGAIIMIIRSGDVIPYIKSITTPAEYAKMPMVPYIWNKTHVDILLENPENDSVVQEKNITMFFTTIEIDGLGKGNVHKLYKSGKTTIAQILNMSINDFINIEGFQKKMAEKLFNGIQEKVKKASLIQIMVASGKLGRGLAERKIKPIIDTYPDILTSTESNEEKESYIKSVSGIGKENSREFVKNIPKFIEFLRNSNLEYKLDQPIKEIKKSINGELTDKKIVMTKVRDTDIINFITIQGAILENTMKKDIYILIVKSKDDISNKIEYAKNNGITMMTVEEFKKRFIYN